MDVNYNIILSFVVYANSRSNAVNTLKDILSYKEDSSKWKIKKSYMWKVAKQTKTFILMSLGPHTVTAYFVHFLLNWIAFIAMHSNCHTSLALEYMPLYNYLCKI